MKERPILFSGDMVRAILEGRKTQTRRAIKSPYKDEHGQPSKGPFKWVETLEGFSACLDLSGDGYDENGCQISFCCPYGVPGDRLWVRETFCECTDEDGIITCYREGYEPCYVAKWKPSIHMPRNASRITLEVTGVRAERLQDISEEDAKAEGVWTDEMYADRAGDGKLPEIHCPQCFGERTFVSFSGLGASEADCDLCDTAVKRFRLLWDSIAKTGAKWEDNPWVWVIEFRRMDNA